MPGSPVFGDPAPPTLPIGHFVRLAAKHFSCLFLFGLKPRGQQAKRPFGLPKGIAVLPPRRRPIPEPPKGRARYHETTRHHHGTTRHYHEPTRHYHETTRHDHGTTRRYHDATRRYHETASHDDETTRHYHEPTQRYHATASHDDETTRRYHEPTRHYHEPTRHYHEATRRYHGSTRHYHETSSRYRAPRPCDGMASPHCVLAQHVGNRLRVRLMPPLEPLCSKASRRPMAANAVHAYGSHCSGRE